MIMNSLKNRLSNSMTDKEVVEDLGKMPITPELGQRRSSRNLLDDAKQEEDPRQELRRDKERHESPKSFLNRRDLTDDHEEIIKRLHENRDKRSLQLPSLVERQSQDYS